MPAETHKNLLEKLTAPLMYGERASASLAAALMGQNPAEFWKSGKDYVDLVKDLLPDADPKLQLALGMAAGIGLDPTTYLGIGAAGKAGKGARALVRFGGKPVVKGEKVLGGLSNVRKGFAESGVGKRFGGLFLGDDTQMAWRGINPSEDLMKYKADLGQKLSESYNLERELTNLYAKYGVDEKTNLEITHYLEKLPRGTRAEMSAAETAVQRALGPESAKIYSFAALQKNAQEETYKRLGYLTDEVQAGFKEKTGLQHLRHFVVNPPKRKKIVTEIEAAGLDPSKVMPGAFLSRHRKGTLKELQQQYGKAAYEYHLPKIMGMSASELAHAEAGVDYLQVLLKKHGVATKLDEVVPEGFLRILPEKDPNNVFARLFEAGDGKYYALPEELKSEVTRVIRRTAEIDDISHGLWGAFDAGTNWWKRTTLYTFPAYHVRNFFGNLWNNHLAGGIKYNDYTDASKLMKRVRTGKMVDGDDILLQGMITHGVLDTGQHAKEFGKNVPDVFKEAWATGSWFPFHNRFKGQQIGMWVASRVENNARIAHYLSRTRMGAEPLDAARSVNKFLFKYGSEGLTKFEDKVMRRIAPFYTWTRKNIPLQLQMLMERPGTFANLTQLTQNISEMYGPLDHEKWMSDWMKDNWPIHLKQDEETGDHQYFFLKSWLPAADLMRLENPVNEIMSMLNPIPKEILQQIINYDLFYEREITAFPDDVNPLGGEQGNFLGMTLNKRLIHLMKNIRMLNEFDRINPGNILGSERAHHTELSPTNKVLRVFFSTTYPFDPEHARQWWYRDFNKRVSELRRQITYSARRGYDTEARRYVKKLQEYRQEKFAEIRG
uniref:Uncharacterized protein n=2 Tax=viral metagenome TaxID=1070528 RepID=A0A6M3XF90_9ZZZZ